MVRSFPDTRRRGPLHEPQLHVIVSVWLFCFCYCSLTLGGPRAKGFADMRRASEVPITASLGMCHNLGPLLGGRFQNRKETETSSNGSPNPAIGLEFAVGLLGAGEAAFTGDLHCFAGVKCVRSVGQRCVSG